MPRLGQHSGIEPKWVSWEIADKKPLNFLPYFSAQQRPYRQLGLAQGDYVLQIRRHGPHKNGFQGRFQKQVPFVVDANSPAVVDLGTIPIENQEND